VQEGAIETVGELGDMWPERSKSKGAEHVVLAPHHPLGLPGGATGADDQQVVAGTSALWLPVLVGAEQFVVRRCPRRRRAVDSDPAHVGEPGANGVDSIGHGVVEDHRVDVHVGPQRGELGCGVAIVGVDVHHPCDAQRIDDFEVLGSVVQRHADVSATTDTDSGESGSDRVGAPAEHVPRQAMPVVDEGDLIGESIRMVVPDIGERPAVIGLGRRHQVG
jgi:hypothetical protein